MRCADGSISIRNGSRIDQKDMSSTIIALSKKKSLKSKLEVKSEIEDGRVVLTLPIRTVSEANNTDHWHIKASRHRDQKKAIAIALTPFRDKIHLPCKIFLTRFATKKLDKHDNLPMSFKYIVDAICSILTGNYVAGQADSDERISIAYDQLTSKEFGIKIEITF